MLANLQDLLWVLLPLAVLSGWLAARHDRKDRPASSDDSYTSRYFRGINFVINEQPDKAIEVFTRMLEVNTETVETHLALGSLFRRRGEVERAIRIHQNLIARPTLDRDQRALALCELALDYHKAGLLDRAENLFNELAEIPAHTEQALRMLMSIYEQEKEWDQALACATRLSKHSGRGMGPLVAQYYCELAEQAIQSGDMQRAQGHLAHALRSDSNCARASLLSGRLAAGASDWKRAIELWQRIEQQDVAFLDEAIDDLVMAYHKLDDEPGLYAYLSSVVQRVPGTRALQRFVELLHNRDGIAAAEAFVVSRIQQQPSLPGLRSLLDLQLLQDSGTNVSRLQLIKENLERLSGEQQQYQCQSCGFRGQILHWQCPACHGWVTMRPATFPVEQQPGVRPAHTPGVGRTAKEKKRQR
jgi:lipopolysaccharide biosynthesis regulator YciM